MLYYMYLQIIFRFTILLYDETLSVCLNDSKLSWADHLLHIIKRLLLLQSMFIWRHSRTKKVKLVSFFAQLVSHIIDLTTFIKLEKLINQVKQLKLSFSII